MLQTIVNGIVNGSLYGLLGIAVVLVLRTNGVANFAQGQLGMLAAFVAYFAVIRVGLPPIAGLVVAALIGAGAAVVMYALVIARRAGSHVNLTIRTLGVDTAILGLCAALWAVGEPYRAPDIIALRNVSIAGLQVSSVQLLILAVTVAIVFALHYLFTRTRLGLEMRAIAENAPAARLAGIPVNRVLLGTWALAGLISGIAAVLYAPLTYLTTTMMVPFLLKAFAAAVLGGVEDWIGVLVGGLALGVIEAFAGQYISYLLQPGIAFALLALVLIFRPEGLFVRSKVRRV